MPKLQPRSLLAAVALVVTVGACDKITAAGSGDVTDVALSSVAADPNIVVILRGHGVPVATPSDVVGTCFETDLYAAKTNRIIGTGLDCLDILAASPEGTSFSINRTTIFNFPQGRLVATGLTTVVPIFGSSSPDFTHVVGDVDDATDNIVSGTNAFENASGNVRLSGIVNLADFPNSIAFNCIFVIEND